MFYLVKLFFSKTNNGNSGNTELRNTGGTVKQRNNGTPPEISEYHRTARTPAEQQKNRTTSINTTVTGRLHIEQITRHNTKQEKKLYGKVELYQKAFS